MDLIRRFFLIMSVLFACNIVHAQKLGCIDPLATNYDSTAKKNDGTCMYKTTTINSTGIYYEASNASVLNEISGLRSFQNGWVTHNDNPSSGFSRINPINDSFEIRKQVYITNLQIHDWEEIADDSQFFYLGDFGNNVDGARRNLQIIKVAKRFVNNELADSLAVSEILNFIYEDQIDFTPVSSNKTDFDCEAMIVLGDSIYLFTKQWNNMGSSIYRLAKSGQNQVAKNVGFLPVNGLVTGADLSPDKSKLILVGYSNLLQPFVVVVFGYENIDFQHGCLRKLNINAPFFQCEGVCWQNDTIISVVNERFSNAFITTLPIIQQFNLFFCWEKLEKRYLKVGKFETMNLRLRVSPNPVKENETVQLIVEGANRCVPIREELWVTNLIGQKLMTFQLHTDRYEMNHLVPGDYFIGNQKLGFVKVTVL